MRIEDRYDSGIEDLWSAITDPTRLARRYAAVGGIRDPAVPTRFRIEPADLGRTGRIEQCEAVVRSVFVLPQPSCPSGRVLHVRVAAMVLIGDVSFVAQASWAAYDHLVCRWARPHRPGTTALGQVGWVSIVIAPATAARFDDVATILGPNNPASTVCWCVSHRPERRTSRELAGPARGEYVRELTGGRWRPAC